MQQGTLKSGEGEFIVYDIRDFDNNPAGYFSPDPNDEGKVGSITVQTPKAATAEGIRVGSTLGDLKQLFPAIEVHGSEIEGATYATYQTLAYRLGIGIFRYEVDMTQIPDETEITEITIQKVIQ